MAPETSRTWSAREIAAVIDHTLLAPSASAVAIEALCSEAREHEFAAVCVNGVHVGLCARLLEGSSVAVSAVIGFPLGANDPRAKRLEARLALDEGARELDMVLQLGALLSGDHERVAGDIEGVVVEAQARGARVKVILETGVLERAHIVAACRIAERAGADFVKTCTGFGPRGVTRADVELLRTSVGPALGVKASGGIKSARFARELLAAGATRLGTSASLAILREAQSG
ncbi:MAG: deoxyribose-phosphate aldolase [Planctomycetes bacterium]|nr:deoxyribose-phosphate aldolase [Planctomycetota bacterium]